MPPDATARARAAAIGLPPARLCLRRRDRHRAGNVSLAANQARVEAALTESSMPSTASSRGGKARRDAAPSFAARLWRRLDGGRARPGSGLGSLRAAPVRRRSQRRDQRPSRHRRGSPLADRAARRRRPGDVGARRPVARGGRTSPPFRAGRAGRQVERLFLDMLERLRTRPPSSIIPSLRPSGPRRRAG